GGTITFNWSVDPQGRLIVTFSGENARIPDVITLISGTDTNGVVTLQSDLNGNSSYDANETLSGSFIKQPQGG
ncbi:hypothetical protein MNBD_NITROSPIRAE01-2310, partial [hydrothermal vent metagenome]